MDPVTAMAIDRGRKNNQLLIQPQYSPMPVGEQIAILYCGTHSLMRDIPISKVRAFQDTFLTNMRANHQADVLDVLASGKINDEVTALIEKLRQKQPDNIKKDNRHGITERSKRKNKLHKWNAENYVGDENGCLFEAA